MSRSASPLRYPGGKSFMAPFFVELFELNGLKNITYIEPYAGGAGAALKLLIDGAVNRIVINDANIAIFSFWHYLKQDKLSFVHEIMDKEINLECWNECHGILRQSKEPCRELGIATFILSRTNRSGILTGGPIGGITQEQQDNSTYKIDCRFNKETLEKQLMTILNYSENILPLNLDALDLLKKLNFKNPFVYLDPPYYSKGASLYLNYYKHKDHEHLSKFLINDATFNWVLSYDDHPAIRTFYGKRMIYLFELNYSASTKKRAQELLVHSKSIVFPNNFQNSKVNPMAIDIPNQRNEN